LGFCSFASIAAALKHARVGFAEGRSFSCGCEQCEFGRHPAGFSIQIADAAGPHDGTVAVEEAKTAAMTDFVTVDETHTTIMYSDAVGTLVVDFLKNERFSR